MSFGVGQVCSDCCGLATADHGEKVNSSYRAAADEEDEGIEWSCKDADEQEYEDDGQCCS